MEPSSVETKKPRSRTTGSVFSVGYGVGFDQLGVGC